MFINYATGEIILKIVYYGTGLCGKTTNLQAIHRSTPDGGASKLLSLATQTDRTLFFDLLPMELGTLAGMRIRLQLYTVPGQVFYNSTRQMVLKGADGVVFVVDSQRTILPANNESFDNLKENLREIGISYDEIPLVFQYNKRDLGNVVPVEELDAVFNDRGVPSFEAQAARSIGVSETLKEITRQVLKRLPFAMDDDKPVPGPAPAPARPSRPGHASPAASAAWAVNEEIESSDPLGIEESGELALGDVAEMAGVDAVAVAPDEPLGAILDDVAEPPGAAVHEEETGTGAVEEGSLEVPVDELSSEDLDVASMDLSASDLPEEAVAADEVAVPDDEDDEEPRGRQVVRDLLAGIDDTATITGFETIQLPTKPTRAAPGEEEEPAEEEEEPVTSGLFLDEQESPVDGSPEPGTESPAMELEETEPPRDGALSVPDTEIAHVTEEPGDEAPARTDAAPEPEPTHPAEMEAATSEPGEPASPAEEEAVPQRELDEPEPGEMVDVSSDLEEIAPSDVGASAAAGEAMPPGELDEATPVEPASAAVDDEVPTELGESPSGEEPALVEDAREAPSSWQAPPAKAEPPGPSGEDETPTSLALGEARHRAAADIEAVEAGLPGGDVAAPEPAAPAEAGEETEALDEDDVGSPVPEPAVASGNGPAPRQPEGPEPHEPEAVDLEEEVAPGPAASPAMAGSVPLAGREEKATIALSRGTFLTESGMSTVRLPDVAEPSAPAPFPGGEVRLAFDGPLYQDSRVTIHALTSGPAELCRGMEIALLADTARLSLIAPPLQRPSGPKMRAAFHLVASTEGWHRVQALALSEGQLLTRASCELFVFPKHHVGEPYVTYAEPQAAAIDTRFPRHAPDLVLSLMSDRVGDAYRISYVVYDRRTRQLTVPRPLDLASSVLSAGRRAVAGVATAAPDHRERNMVAAGTALWAAVLPPEVQELLAAERDGVDSLLVATEDTWIPWELLRPTAGTLPLGARMRIGQWPGALTPRGDLARSQALAILDSDDDPPGFVPDSATVCHSREAALFSLTGRPLDVVALRGVAALDPDLPAFTSLGLRDGFLQAADLNGLAGELREGRPWILLDAVHPADAETRHDSGAAAWATSLVGRLGAGGLVAPRVALPRDVGQDAWSRISQLLLGGMTVGAALREIRRHALSEPGADLGAATFALYGDPDARLAG